ncbi:MAG: hypothetical protein A3K19_14335 [Lentisphaerae bacterium RIFOXYB12_FULL_65_16]|nr:MAG: hypothetical protein A3K18_18380 [Lentisphaerae bacterium RIFOXYA12_64_32]OGV87401.1 MAG: hypothetical protein A3K19_14335 [Lentisphaerae bacterium RIFOXYB12_FULL_65_16]
MIRHLVPLVCLPLAWSACRAADDRTAPPPGDLLFQEDFAKGMDNWWVEGGRKVWIEDGRLHVDADPPKGEPGQVCTVWCRHEFSGDLRLEVDCHVLASHADANNINFFLLYADPAGQPLWETRDTRADGAYPKYHDLDGYIFTFLNDARAEGGRDAEGATQARFRIRRCPGFKLLSETFAGHCQRETTYHACITRIGQTLTIAVDGKVCLEARDEQPLERGLIGLRTFQTRLWWDNVRVSRPANER